MTAFSFGLPQKPAFVEYVSYDSAFMPHEVDRIRTLWNAEHSNRAEIAGIEGQDYDDSLRQSSVMFLQSNSDNTWIYERLAMIAHQTNYQYYYFDMSGFEEELQLAEYGEGDFFEWHMDFGPGPISHRKLSLTVQLSDPGDYDGGDLQFMINNKVVNAPREKGSVIVFPSFVLHRVTPITRGSRNSIVGWVGGIPYR